MKTQVVNIVCSHFLPHVGGVERFVDHQSKELIKLGFQVNIITSNTENSKFYEVINERAIYRISSFSVLKKNRLPTPYNLMQIFKIYKRCFFNKPSLTIIHTRFFPIDLLGVILGRLSGSKIVIIDHSSGYIEFDSNLLNKFAVLYDHMLTFFIKLFRPSFYGVSKACNLWLKHFRIKADGVYYNGIDFNYEINNKFDVKEKNNILGKEYIFYCGRLIREKGIIELIEGFVLFQKNNPEYFLIIAGNGMLEMEISEYTKNNSHILFVGRLSQDEVFNYMSQAAMFVNPSNYPEGLPTVLLEAGKYAVPVISTPNGGAKEIIINNETGILIEKGEINLISEALNLLVNNPEKSMELGLHLQNLVKSKFDWSIITDDFILNTLKLRDD